MNPAAFPSPGVVLPGGLQQGAYEGMSLRQWYAGLALQGYLTMLAGPDVTAPHPEEAAQQALAYADALINHMQDHP